MAHPHSSLREGTALGVIVATTIWIWLAAVDALAGQPFQTFRVLGGVAFFTVLHYGLCVVYGVVTLSVVHAAARAPSLMVFAAFSFFLLEFGFVMATVLLANVGLGELAWVRMLGGNVIGAVVTWVVLVRRHPLLKEFRQADREE